MPLPIAMLVEAREPGALNLCRAFREAGHEVALLNRGPHKAEGDADIAELARPSAVVDLYRQGWRAQPWFDALNGAGHRLARLGSIAGPPLVAVFDRQLARPIQERVSRAVRETGAEVVYSFWGIGQLPELRALQRASVGCALVNHFQTYPLTRALAAEPPPASPIERAVFARLEGRVHASARMEQFVNESVRPVRGLDQVLPDAWGSWACARERLPLLAERDGAPHVVHVGVPPSRPGSFDDVGPHLQAIAREGVRVHAVEGFRGEGITNFPPMGPKALLTGEVARFMTQFDAVVLAYHAPPGLAWFAGNLPARFQSGVSAGVPLAVPRGLFGAVQDFVEQHGNGVVYDSPAHLGHLLRDPERMAKARKLAEALAREHRLDRFLPRYQQFLDRVLDLRAGKAGEAATLK